MAQKIIGVIKNERRQMIRGIERLCDAYISLAYMDASKHKNDKSEWSEHSDHSLVAVAVCDTDELQLNV